MRWPISRTAKTTHPELVVGYKTCQVRYDTHSVNGLSINDFVCAAKADALGQA